MMATMSTLPNDIVAIREFEEFYYGLPGACDNDIIAEIKATKYPLLQPFATSKWGLLVNTTMTRVILTGKDEYHVIPFLSVIFAIPKLDDSRLDSSTLQRYICRTGDINALERWLALDVNVNFVQSEYNAIFKEACHVGYTHIAERLRSYVEQHLVTRAIRDGILDPA